MKRLVLPLALLTFTVICLSIVHLDNINKLNAASQELRERYEKDTFYDQNIRLETVPEIKRK